MTLTWTSDAAEDVLRINMVRRSRIAGLSLACLPRSAYWSLRFGAGHALPVALALASDKRYTSATPTTPRPVNTPATAPPMRRLPTCRLAIPPIRHPASHSRRQPTCVVRQRRRRVDQHRDCLRIRIPAAHTRPLSSRSAHNHPMCPPTLPSQPMCRHDVRRALFIVPVSLPGTKAQ